jgi:hypothetical protein
MRYLVEQTIHGWCETYREAGQEVLELEQRMREHGWFVRHTEFEAMSKPHAADSGSTERMYYLRDADGTGWTLEVFRWET